jgi:predicted acetyltransferase/GNAT superfamily N-acetyltransferase
MSDDVLSRPRGEAEWAAYHDLRRTEIFARYYPDKIYDPEDADEHEERNLPHLFFRRGEPVGTIRIDCLDRERAAFRLITIRSALQRQGLGGVLLQMAEERAALFGFGEVSLNAALPALGFYQRHGYTPGPWFDVNPEREDSLRVGKRLARPASRRPLALAPPSLDGIAGYAAALEAGWSPDTMRDVSGEQLALYREDPASLLNELIRQDGMIKSASGEMVPRLPSRTFWLDDGDFCGSINLRFQPGTEELPPQVSGHVGYAVVPWKRRRGYATAALGLMLPVAREAGLRRLTITSFEDNEASRRVILANGGVLEGRGPHAGRTRLFFRIDLPPSLP